VRDYDRLKEEYLNVLYEHKTPVMDGIKRGSRAVGNPTAEGAIRLERLSSKMEAVEQALMCVPEEYRKGVEEHAKYKKEFPRCAGRTTWQTWQARFLWHVARRLDEI